MAKQFLDEDGVRQIWSAAKGRFLDKTTTTAQTVAGDVTFGGNIKSNKQIEALVVSGTTGLQVGTASIMQTGASAQTFNLPSAASGTFALVGDIPAGVVTATGDNNFTGSNTFKGGIATTSESGTTQYADGKILVTRSGETSTINIPTPSGTNTFLTTADKGANNGVASLNAEGKVPAAQLPSYVDDVREYASKSKFPATGEVGVIYIALDTNKTYRWGSTTYVEISPSLALGETADTAYAGNKGKANADAITVLQTTKLDIGATPTVDSVRVKNKSGVDGLVEYSQSSVKNAIVRRDSVGGIVLRSLGDGETYFDNEAVPFSYIKGNYASLTAANTFTATNIFNSNIMVKGLENTFLNEKGFGIVVRKTDKSVETSYNAGTIVNQGYHLTLPSVAGTIALVSDIPSPADYAKLSGDNTFTGTNEFTGNVALGSKATATNYIFIDADDADGDGLVRFSTKSIRVMAPVDLTYNYPSQAGTLLVDADITAIPEATLIKILV